VTSRQRLFALEAFGIKLGLENMRTLVAALGHPEQAYSTVHIAGTNGKGSTSAMVERGLRASGLRTGLYTSPHLDRIEERMAIDGVPVDPALFDQVADVVFATVDAARAAGPLAVTPTFFEVTTAMAFEVFRRAAVEVAVIEVGLGGRFDATNVIIPIVGAITSIAFDHERHLGHTLGAIAFEKAGIAKHGVPLVVGELPDEAMAVVAARAAEMGAPLRLTADAALVTTTERGVVQVRGGAAHLPPTRVALLGRHQAANAATAIGVLRACEEAGLPVSASAIATGLAGAHWPARLEWLQVGAGQVLLDAAHNPAGAEALASYLSDAAIPPLPMVLVTMQDKNLGDGRPPGAARVAVGGHHRAHAASLWGRCARRTAARAGGRHAGRGGRRCR
jgi:dihydrofolate synthase / folylpolyglutamate synthase